MKTEGKSGNIELAIGDTVEVIIGHHVIMDDVVVDTKKGHIGKQAVVEQEVGEQCYIRFNDGSNNGCWKKKQWLKKI